MLHLLLTMLTLGLWLPVWIALAWRSRLWACAMCGALAGRGVAGLERIEAMDLTPEDRQRIESDTTFVKTPWAGVLLFVALAAFIAYLAFRG